MALGGGGGGGGGEAAGGEGAPASDGDSGSSLAGFWPAWVVALVAALLAWLWYGRGAQKEKKDKGEKEAQATGGGAPLCGKAPQEEPNQRNYETKQTDVSSLQDLVENQFSSSDHCALNVPNNSPETEPLVKESTIPLMNYKEYLRATTPSEPALNQESEKHGGGPSSEKCEEKCKEKLQHSVDEEWEIVPEHSGCDSTTRKSSVDDASSKDTDPSKRVAAVSPMPQTVHVTFRVHYVTHSETQLLAITGDHECLGQWQHYVPLRCDKDWFWSDSVVVPVDTRIEWKFIVVENGKVRRWEECDNRTLTTEHVDRVAHLWWGYH
ncbi:starch-binding domain-containing protein 1 [Anolis carolinensis]|uniref:starch-binding domain-containing protein 1 n=1 Tax=Anolis carolinensis TaxID=28377 RepID=UPI002F2B654D